MTVRDKTGPLDGQSIPDGLPGGPRVEDLKATETLAGLRAVAREQDAGIVAMPKELLGPASKEEIDRIARTLSAARARHPLPDDAVAADDVPQSSLHARPRRWRWLAAAACPIAIAAGLIFVVRGPGTEFPLPAYSMTTSGGIREFRDVNLPVAGPPIARAQRNTELTIVCRPEYPVQGAVTGRLFLVRGDDVREISARWQTSSAGSLEIRFNPIKDGGATTGRWQARIVVGRPGVVAGLSPAAALAMAIGPQHWWSKSDLEVIGD